MNEVLELLEEHRSIRAFENTAVPDDIVAMAVEAASMAATSSHVMAYSLIRVVHPEKREALVSLAGGQPWVAECGAFFVVCADERRNQLAVASSDAPFESNFESFLVSVIDASLFSQNLVIAFESLGYGICYIGGLRNDLPRVRDLFRIPDRVYPLYGLCVGIPAEDPAPKPRLAARAIVHDDEYPTDAVLREGIAEFDERAKAYYAERGNEGRSWIGGLVRKYAKANRDEVVEFYRSQGGKF